MRNELGAFAFGQGDTRNQQARHTGQPFDEIGMGTRHGIPAAVGQQTEGERFRLAQPRRELAGRGFGLGGFAALVAVGAARLGRY